MIEQFKDAFKEEAVELLNQLEEKLLELEESPLDKEIISSVFRTMHTIKGSSAMFGFESISRFTHEVESIMDSLREGKFIADRGLIDLTLETRDHLRDLLNDPPKASPELESASSDLIARFKAFTDRRIAEKRAADGEEPEVVEVKAAKPEAAGTIQGKEESKAVVTYRIGVQPHPTILNNGTNPLLLVGELAELGDCTVTPVLGTIPLLDAIDPQSCYVGWMVVLSTTKDENAIRDIFIFVEGDCDLKVERITDRDLIGDEPPKKIGQILIERGITSPEKISEALSEQRKIGEVLVEKNVVTADQVKSALEEQDHLRKLHEKQDQSTSIRVGSDKLDALVDLVGEMVTLQARLTQTTNAFKDAQLSSITEQFERLVSQLRDNTMTMRMLPIGTTFSKFRRLVRDLSADLHKEAEIVTEGAETELDKTVIEKLNDPLVHLIRNSLDHGIESPEERRAAGKDPKGTIKLSAAHAGANVLVTVSDDGAGLNREAIYRKAVEKGLVGANVEIADAELFQLIFAAGFSTAKTVTSVSGRGVGMDVVRREIESLGGSVGIETVPAKGTKFTLRIPLTLAIIEGLLVKIGDGFFVVPLQSVDGCIEIKSSEASGAGKGRAITSYRGDLLPYIGLREFFNFETTPPEIMQIVIVNALESRIGLVVDSVIGEYQTVIKPLGRMFHDVEGLSGATILGDGTVALIMDVNRLAVMKNREEIHTRSIATSGRG